MKSVLGCVFWVLRNLKVKGSEFFAPIPYTPKLTTYLKPKIKFPSLKEGCLAKRGGVVIHTKPQNPKPKTQNPQPKTQNPKPKPQNHFMKYISILCLA
ncbi:MAG: hypothetical protein RL131_385, partial [Bacteroidota bacterium]